MNQNYDDRTGSGNVGAFGLCARLVSSLRGVLICALYYCGAQSPVVGEAYELEQYDTIYTTPWVNAYPAQWNFNFGVGDPNTSYILQWGCGSTVGSDQVGGVSVTSDPSGVIAPRVYNGGSSNDFVVWQGEHSEGLAPPPAGVHYQVGKVYWAILSRSVDELDRHSIGVVFDVHMVWQGGNVSPKSYSVPAILFTLYPAGVGGVPSEGRPATGWEGMGSDGAAEHAELEGNTIRIPYLNEAAENATLILEIGGETYEMQVLPGLNILDWKIPPQWDGTYSLNGEEYDLSHDAINLGTLEFPSWMHKPIEVTDFGSDYAIIKDSEGQTYHVPSSPPVGAIPSDVQGIVNLDEPVKTPDGHGDDDIAASADAFADIVAEGEAENIPDFPDFESDAVATRDGLIEQFEGLAPLSGAGLPRASSMSVRFTNPFSSAQIGGDIDLTKSPFPFVRVAILVCFGWYLTVQFMRRVTI